MNSNICCFFFIVFLLVFRTNIAIDFIIRWMILRLNFRSFPMCVISYQRLFSKKKNLRNISLIRLQFLILNYSIFFSICWNVLITHAQSDKKSVLIIIYGLCVNWKDEIICILYGFPVVLSLFFPIAFFFLRKLQWF